MAGSPWTPDEETKLRNLAAAGKSRFEIADALDRSPNAIRFKAKEMEVDVRYLQYGESTQEKEPAFEVEELPSELPSALTLLDQRETQYARKAKAKEARRLIPVNVRLHGPVGIAHMGGLLIRRHRLKRRPANKPSLHYDLSLCRHW